MSYTLTKKIQDEKFDVNLLSECTLNLHIGTRNLQTCVIHNQRHCWSLQDYHFGRIRTTQDRLRVLDKIFYDHTFLKAGYWKKVRVCVKTHKFSLVPLSFYSKEARSYYLCLNRELDPTHECPCTYKHNRLGVANVFVSDLKLLQWIASVYPKQALHVVHQGSLFIEGVLHTYKNLNKKGMFCMLDGNVLHVLVTDGKKFQYYNQFSLQKANDILRYTQLVFKELGLRDSKQPSVFFYGNAGQESQNVRLLKKYFTNITPGRRPQYLSCNYAFDELPTYCYFDTMSADLC